MVITCFGRRIPLVLPVALVLIAVVFWLIWFGAASLFMKKETVEFELQQLSLKLQDIGKEYNQDINFTYGEVEVNGWGYKKQAIIHDVTIESIDKNASHLKFKFFTENAVVSLDPLSSKHVIVSFAKPIDIYQNDYSIGSLVFSEPLLVSYTQVNVESSKGGKYDVILPLDIGMAPSKLITSTVVNGNVYSVNFSKTPTLQYISIPDRKISSLYYDFSGFSVLHKEDDKITIGEWTSHSDEKATNIEGRLEGKYSVDINDIVVQKGAVTTKPYALVINTDYVIESVKLSSEENPDTQTTTPAGDNDSKDNRTVTVNEFLLSNPDFNIRATGKFANIVGDELPSGEINIDVENIQKFLDSELMMVQNRKVLDTMLEKITGKPIAGQTQVSIPLKRERAGVFYVGNTTFDELAILLLSESMMPMPPADAPNVAVPPSPPVPDAEGSSEEGSEGADALKDLQMSLPPASSAPVAPTAVPFPPSTPPVSPNHQ